MARSVWSSGISSTYDDQSPDRLADPASSNERTTSADATGPATNSNTTARPEPVKEYIESIAGGPNVARRARNAGEWPGYLTNIIAREIAYWRQRNGMSARELEERTAEMGWRVPRAVIANIENGRRESVAVHELIMIAAALDVAPILLIAPVGRSELMTITPHVTMTPWTVRGWFHGVLPLTRLSEIPRAAFMHWRRMRRAITLYDEHRVLERTYLGSWRGLRRIATTPRSDSSDNPFSSESSTLRAMAENYARTMKTTLEQLREHRNQMTKEDFVLPELDADILNALQTDEVLAAPEPATPNGGFLFFISPPDSDTHEGSGHGVPYQFELHLPPPTIFNKNAGSRLEHLDPSAQTNADDKKDGGTDASPTPESHQPSE